MKWKLTKTKRHDLKSNKGILVADSPERLEEAVRSIENAKVLGVDTETFGVMDSGDKWDVRDYSPVKKSRIVSVQFSTENVPKLFVPNWGQYEGSIRAFKKILEDSKETKVLHNAKFDMHSLANHGINMRGLLADTMVMDFCFYTANYHGLKECMSRYFSIDTKEYAETFKQPRPLKKGGFGKSMFLPSLIDVVKTLEGVEKLVDYSTKDPDYTVQLYNYLCNKLSDIPWTADYSMLDYYKLFERPYTEVLYEMERRGCLVDKEYLQELQTAMTEDCDEIKKQFLKECVSAGIKPSELETFNMNSGEQIGKLFEQKLGIEIEDKTPTGKPKTDDASLMKIRGKGRKIAAKLLEYKKLEKLKGTYVDPFIYLHGEYDGRVHSTLKQIGTATMRLSSAAPNLQNIPTSYKDYYGIRHAFVAPKGCVVGDIDLSQIEMRLAAHFTQDPMMVKAINEDWDLHSLTASKTIPEVKDWMNGREPTKELLKEVKNQFKEARDKKAKTLNFSTLYGAGGKKIAFMTGVSEIEGERMINEFFTFYKGLKRGIDGIRRQCYKDGYVKTLLQRRIHIPDIHNEEKWIRLAAERQAFNYVIQGSAADLLKMAMILIHKDERLKELGARMTLQIHDELLFEIQKGTEEEVTPIIQELVSHPYLHTDIYGKKLKKLLVDTPADFSVGESWKEAKG